MSVVVDVSIRGSGEFCSEDSAAVQMVNMEL